MTERAYRMAEVVAMLGEGYTKPKVHRIINKFSSYIKITGSDQNTRYPESSIAILKTIVSLMEQGKTDAEIEKTIEKPAVLSADDQLIIRAMGAVDKTKKEGELEKHKHAVQMLKKISTIEAELHSLKQMLLSGL